MRRRLVAALTVVFALVVVAVGASALRSSPPTPSQQLPLPSYSSVSADTAAVTLGVKFSPSVDGYVTGVWFRRDSKSNTAREVQLWDSAGRKLASSACSSVKMGPVHQSFDEPVPVKAGATYVASYFAPAGRYNSVGAAHTYPQTRGYLTAPKDAGVWISGPKATFPTQTWNSSDYQVTPVFVANLGAAPSPPARTASPTHIPTDTASPTSTPTTVSPSPTNTTTWSSPTATAAGCTNPVWTSSDADGSWSDSGYVVNNNLWSGDAGPQTMKACAWNRWSVTSDQPGAGADDSVKTYPDTQKHVNLPLSSLSTLPSSFDVTVPRGGGTVPPNGKQWNAAYDLWLDNWSTEVMVWNDWTMNWQYWYGQNGGVDAVIDGVTYHAYTNGSGLWFVRANPTDKGTVDLAHLLQWAVGKGWIEPSAVLQEVEYGFEVSYTGEPTTFTLNDYSLTLP